MQLISNKTEARYRAELILSRDELFKKNGAPRLLKILRTNYPDLDSAFVLHWIPEQGEDIYEILINEHEILAVEISRIDTGECVTKIISLDEFLSRTRSKQKMIKLAVALDLIRGEK